MSLSEIEQDQVCFLACNLLGLSSCVWPEEMEGGRRLEREFTSLQPSKNKHR